MNAANAPRHDAEFSILSALLWCPDHLPAVAERISASDFADRRCGAAFRAIVELAAAGRPIDVTALAHALGTKTGSDPGAVEAFCLSLTRSPSCSKSLPHYCDVVQGESTLRQVAALCRQAADRADDADWSEAVAVQNQLMSTLVARSAGSTSSLTDIRDAAISVVEGAQERYSAMTSGQFAPPAYISTGIEAIDLATGAYRDGHLHVLGAQSGHGKTAWGVWSGFQAAKKSRRHTLYISVEINPNDVALRLIAAEGGVNSELVESGRLDASAGGSLDRMTVGVNSVKQMRGLMSIAYKPGATVTFVRHTVQAYMQRSDVPPLGLVVVDYLQRLKPEKRESSRESEVRSIACALTEVAQTFRVPVLALAQLNRSYATRADKKPVVSDLRESAVIEHEASQIAFIHRPGMFDDKPDSDECLYIVRKNRKGRVGQVPIRFEPRYQRFSPQRRTGAWS